MMNVSQRKALLVTTVAAVMYILTQSLFAQTVDADHATVARAAMEEAMGQAGIQSKPSMAARDKADAAMAPRRTFPTEADRKAAASMSVK